MKFNINLLIQKYGVKVGSFLQTQTSLKMSGKMTKHREKEFIDNLIEPSMMKNITKTVAIEYICKLLNINFDYFKIE